MERFSAIVHSHVNYFLFLIIRFRYSSETHHLIHIPPLTYQPPEVKAWSQDTIRVQELVTVAENSLRECQNRLALNHRTRIIRKERACGLICTIGELSREQLDEFALSTQRRLQHFQHVQGLSEGAPMIPFCAFNGGSDVWIGEYRKLSNYAKIVYLYFFS